MNTAKRFAVLTGASRGIGRALAFALARDGYDLAVCSRSQAKLDELQAELAKVHPDIILHTMACDVSRRKEVDRFAAQVLKWSQRVDALINNAGVFIMGTILGEEEGRLEQMLDTNLLSAYHLTRALAPHMVARGSGDIVNICSVASLQAYPGGGSYSISKHALLGFSRNLRNELKPAGVRVTAVMPGAVLTDSWSGVDLPEERFINVEDLADMIAGVLRLSPRTVVEDIVIRPQPGDI
ncbi:MAG: SDR family NAD(P)-dependent oxidoreductase [Bacteroidetes bacterium]|nr:SDR family NAD(P)-dependent oxidoreductase [Bacteroidota bacterium]